MVIWATSGVFWVQVVGRTRAAPGATHPSQANGTLDVILSSEEPDASRNLNVSESVQAHMIRAGVARLVAKSSLRSPSARAAAQVLRPHLRFSFPVYVCLDWGGGGGLLFPHPPVGQKANLSAQVLNPHLHFLVMYTDPSNVER